MICDVVLSGLMQILRTDRGTTPVSARLDLGGGGSQPAEVSFVYRRVWARRRSSLRSHVVGPDRRTDVAGGSVRTELTAFGSSARSRGTPRTSSNSSSSTQRGHRQGRPCRGRYSVSALDYRGQQALKEVCNCGAESSRAPGESQTIDTGQDLEV